MNAAGTIAAPSRIADGTKLGVLRGDEGPFDHEEQDRAHDEHGDPAMASGGGAGGRVRTSVVLLAAVVL